MAETKPKRFTVPSHWTLAQRLEHYSDRTGGPQACWLWKADKDADGYGKYRWNKKQRGAHRRSYEIHFGPIPAGLSVLHNCPGGDNPSCINPTHLWLGTQKQNMEDRDGKGRGHLGKPRPDLCKVSDEAIRAIRADKRPRKLVAADHGVHVSYISSVRLRNSRPYVPDEGETV